MDDPIFTYGILRDLADSEIRLTKVIFLDNPSITLKRISTLFLVYGPIYFFEFVGAYLWWNLLKGGRVKSLFDSRGIECLSYNSTQLDLVERKLGTIEPELIVSVNCNVRLPQTLLEKAKFGGINLHQGSLPDYKGLMPIFYSQLADEPKVGSSIHIMNSKFDSGEILIKEEIDILPGENYVQIWKKLNRVGSANLIKVLCFFNNNGALPSSKKQELAGRYFSLPSTGLVMSYFFLQLRRKFLRY
jgi:folate-dependent phosphoribosylglycinamide formyltransferase PurN